MILAKPTVHLNGTSKRELASQLETAANSLRAAIQALEEASPNGRDYDLFANADSFTNASDQHRARHERLCVVYSELMDIWEHVADQGESPARSGASGESRG